MQNSGSWQKSEVMLKLDQGSEKPNPNPEKEKDGHGTAATNGIQFLHFLMGL